MPRQHPTIRDALYPEFPDPDHGAFALYTEESAEPIGYIRAATRVRMAAPPDVAEAAAARAGDPSWWPAGYDPFARVSDAQDAAAYAALTASRAYSWGDGAGPGGLAAASAVPPGAIVAAILRLGLSQPCPGCGAGPGELCRADPGDDGAPLVAGPAAEQWEQPPSWQEVTELARLRADAAAAMWRQPGPLDGMPEETPLTVAAGPGRDYEAWRHVAPGVWIGQPGEATEDRSAEQATAAEVRELVAARELSS